ncbi:MAG TPA: hypothetical protein VNQ73_02035 [Ilumatobacter sp.]|nr:hypothetical protein [Ilumatobacter sp.]
MGRARQVVAALVAASALVACGGSDGATPSTPDSTAPTTVAATSAPTTAPPPPTALVPGTDGGDPLYPEPTPPPTEPLITTPPVAVTTTPPTTVADTAVDTGPPSSEPLSVQELVLSREGVGSALFGTDPDAVISYISSILGSNTSDSGWTDPDRFGCPGNEVRRVDWGVLSLLFSDASDITTGRRHFLGWEYGRLGTIGDEPVGLRTAGGVTIGARVVDVFGEFPDATLIEGDPDVELPDYFYVGDDSFMGWLSGIGEDDFVTVLFGGYRCGG